MEKEPKDTFCTRLVTGLTDFRTERKVCGNSFLYGTGFGLGIGLGVMAASEEPGSPDMWVALAVSLTWFVMAKLAHASLPPKEDGPEEGDPDEEKE